MLSKVYKAFGFSEDTTKATPFGSGLINYTWKMASNGKCYILQKINDQVFRDPGAIAFNINATAAYLHRCFPHYLFVVPVKSVDNQDIFVDKETGYFRLSPFIENSHTIDVAASPEQGYEAARQFGQFTKCLAGFDVTQLKITLPDFHNLSLRYKQFEDALVNGNADRKKKSESVIDFMVGNKYIVDVYEKIKENPQFKLRATHHDTKISNVLFDKNNKGLCVIDLDTLMPGYFISDVGDMLRTYLSPVSEEEGDFSKIEIREDYFKAIAEGYLGEMGDELTDSEKNHFAYAGKFLIYMQALRFLTDYLNDDVYYGSKYEGHNFIRAKNQMVLLERFIEKEETLKNLIEL
ncbi:MAG: aminoglycoside phosphotransferase family protein [Gloeobacteraceae cyanobacterium ES-bin-316]|nr:aminoglycoside phosphotransferase family protein [Ferruginibacter sp.]